MVVLPTLNRPERLKKFLKSVVDTDNRVHGLILVDKEDAKKNQEAYEKIAVNHLPPNWTFRITDAVTMGGKCREVVPQLWDAVEWVMVVNDDHICASEKCLDYLVSKLDGKNFVSANDRTINAFSFPVTATAWSVPLLKCLGWPIYPPFLEHLFIDNLWRDLGKATGCWRMCAGAVVLHEHVLWGKAEEDDTHRKVYGENFNKGEPGEMWKNDEANYARFMQTEFQIAVQRIKQFQNFLPGQMWNPKVSGEKSN